MNEGIEELRSTGLKATMPRLKILEIFQNTDGTQQRHMTADDVYRILLTDGSDIGLATVYRVLTQFEQAGILLRHHFEGGKAVYEISDDAHHDHMICLSCGRVEEFFDEEIERRHQNIAKARGFLVVDHEFTLYGYCDLPECQEQARRSGRGR